MEILPPEAFPDFAGISESVDRCSIKGCSDLIKGWSLTHSLIHSIHVHQATSTCQALGTQKWKTQWSLLWSIWRCCGHWDRKVCSGQARLVPLKGGGFRSHVMGSGPLRKQNCTISLPLTEQNCDRTENIKALVAGKCFLAKIFISKLFTEA